MISFYQTLRKGCSFMLKRAPLLSHSMLLLLFCMVVQTCVAQEDPDINDSVDKVPGKQISIQYTTDKTQAILYTV